LVGFRKSEHEFLDFLRWFRNKDMPGQTDLNLGTERLTTEANDQLLFLLKILQSIHDVGCDADVIYPLLKQNLELLNEGIIEVLKNWVDSKFEEYERKLIASEIGIFGILIYDLPLGNISVNLEIAIACYEILLANFTVNENPKTWALVQNNLAIAYTNRIKGDRADNIEQAIAEYQTALTIQTLKDFHQDWASTQNNLAITYTNRIKGNRAENIEQAIAGHQAALTIYTLKNFPKDWATIQSNLAAAYIDRIKGNKAANIEEAIAGCKAALTIYTLEDSPRNWALIQDNLAEAYSERIIGKPTNNFQQALDYYQLSLEVFTIDSFPNQWVSIQLKLAKLSIEKMHNYHMAMEHLEAAYEHLSINNSDTGLLAQTMFDMARCFHQTGSLDQAKIYFKDAIRIYQRLEQPTEVAAATSALGNLELQMGLTQDAQEHLQTALEFYQAAGQTDHVTSIQALQQHLPIKLREIAS
jgi:tetratricopeptide (TPR) repeat protein